MRKIAVIIACLFATSLSAQTKFQLAPPLLIYPSSFFKGSTELVVIFNQPGASVHYTLDGKEPTESSAVYTKPIKITGTRVSVKAKTFGNGYDPSETASVVFVGGGKPIQNISFTPPHESYAKVPANILNDNIGGITQYGSGSWLGYNADTVEINIDLNQKDKIRSVLLEMLQDENSWIFLPQKIELYYLNAKQQHILASSSLIEPGTKAQKQCVLKEIKLPGNIRTDKLRLRIKTVGAIPDWHPGKGQHGWFFIDEIKVY
jgi:hypothetical protein